jgi:hypothetical protein
MPEDYPHEVDCQRCSGPATPRGPAGHGTPRVEYVCEDCGAAGCIRATDNRRFGPVFPYERYSETLLADNDALTTTEVPPA